jgi:hypothetical protein
MHLPILIGLAFVLALKPIAKNIIDKKKDKIEQRKQKRRER